MNKIIALIDGSIYSKSVCDHGAWIAGRTGAAVELMHVLGRRETSSEPQNLSGNITLGARTALLEELSALDEQRAKLAQRRGRAILEDAAATLKEGGVENVTTKLRIGDLVETVAASEAECDMIVLGKRGEAADFAKLHLGSNLERVVRASKRPIFVAARAFKPIETVLIAFDGGKSSLKAVDDMARSTLYSGLSCRLLHVGTDTVDLRRRIEGAEAVLKSAGHSASFDIVEGQPDRVIAETVERDGIDLLVMGAYGHSRIRNLIIGSTTAEMIRSCKIPIVLYR